MSKYKDVKDFFKEELKDLTIDAKLAKQLKTFRLNWSTKSPEYMDFLGSNLMGVHVIRFSVLDDESLMSDIFGICDYMELQKDIFDTKGIEKRFKIASNIVYQTLTYVLYRFLNDKLDKDTKEAGIKEVCLLLQYKMFCSLYSWYFKYSVPEHIATAVYNKLSHKFLIKQMDTWQDVFNYRVDDCMDKSSASYNKIKNYDSKNSIDLISGIQTKLREQVKSIYKVLMDVIENDEAIMSEGSTFIGGENNEEQVRDKTLAAITYINKMKSIATNANDFIDKDTLTIVNSFYKNIKIEIAYKYLKCMTNEKTLDHEELMKIIEDTLTISFSYLQRSNINIEQRENIPKALVAIRFYWSSSKVKNERMIEIKETLSSKVKYCTGMKTPWVAAGLSLTYITYLFLRALK